MSTPQQRERALQKRWLGEALFIMGGLILMGATLFLAFLGWSIRAGNDSLRIVFFLALIAGFALLWIGNHVKSSARPGLQPDKPELLPEEKEKRAA